MGLEPTRVPVGYPRSPMERYMLLAYVLRQGQNSPEEKQNFLTGLEGLKNGAKEFFVERLDKTITELAA